jgi:hypothetical protein
MKKMNFTSFLKLMLIAIVSLIGTKSASAQEKLDLFISDPTTCRVYLTGPMLGAAGDSFTVIKVGLENPISGVAQPDPTKSYFVKLFRFNKGTGDARGAASVRAADDGLETEAAYDAMVILNNGVAANPSAVPPVVAVPAVPQPLLASLGQASLAVGQEYLVTYMDAATGLMTSKRVRVYDNAGPVVTASPNAVPAILSTVPNPNIPGGVIRTYRLDPISIRCTELVNGSKVPAPGSVVSGLGVQTGTLNVAVDAKTRLLVPRLIANNPNGINVDYTGSGIDFTSSDPDWVRFSINDCHDITWVRYADSEIAGLNDCPTTGLCTYGTVTRTWTFKDRFGNESKATQVITIIKPHILFPTTGVGAPAIDPATSTTGTISVNALVSGCNDDASKVGLPFADWNCNGFREAGEDVASGEGVCGRIVTAGATTRMDLCPGSYMLVRTWKYVTCATDGTGLMFYTINQNVTVNDTKAPTVSLYYRDFARVPQEQVVCMGAMKIVQYVYGTSVDHWQDGFKGHTSVAKGANGLTNGTDVLTIQINPLMDITSCTTASIDVMVGALDPECSKMTTLSSPRTGLYAPSPDATNIRFNGMESMKINDGERVRLTGDFSALANGMNDPFFYIEGTDPCGNVTRIKVVVNVIDNISPATICEDKEVTLTNTGKAVITGRILTNGTSDNCTLAFEDKITPNNPMNGRILVRRMGSDCWVENFLVDCNDSEVMVQVRVLDMMNNYSDCMVRVIIRDKSVPTCPMSQPVTTICTDPRLSNLEAFFTQPQAYDNCAVDFVSATAPVANLTCGAGSVTKTWTFRDKQGTTVSCNQTLTITSIQGYRVKPLASELLSCNYAFDKEAERKKALANILLLRGDGASSCSAPTVEVESWEYSSSEFCKIIRIRYTIQDACRTFPAGQGLPAYVRLRSTFFDVAGNRLVNGEQDGSIGQAVTSYRYYDGSTSTNTYYQDNGAGTFGFERFVYVLDRTKPTSVVPVIAPICAAADACTFDFQSIPLTGEDLCSDGSKTNSNLYFDWSITTKKGGVDKTVTGTTATINPANHADLRGVDLGTYTISYSIKDGCGNINWYSFTITGKDCKSPYINTHNKETVLAYNQSATVMNMRGMSSMDLDVPGGRGPLNDVYDFCTPLADLLPKMRFVKANDNPTNTYPAGAGRTINFNCNDFMGENPVATQVWAIDNSGNAVYNIVYITVQDNTGACGTDKPQSIVKGSLKTENAQPAKAVTLTASMAGTIAREVTTDATGDFTFNVNQGSNYVVKAAKLVTDDKYAGVTTFDIARISKHLLDIEPFTSPYQHIAADVDKSGAVDVADVLHVRNFLLRKTTSLPAGVWRFIDKSYQFKNPSNPFAEDFPEAVNISNAKASEAVNFVAVKFADVNATYTSNLVSTVVRSNNALVLNVEDMNVVAGNEYTVNVTADNFNAAAFQGTFGIANAAIKSVKAGDLKNYSDGNFGIFANEITTSWNGQAKGAANVFAVTFVANKSGKLSEMMTVGSSLTPAIANDATGTEMNINLKFSTGKVAGGEFALYQNTPNPVAQETSIGFNMPKEGAAKLTIYSVEGKVVMTKNIAAKAGVNQISINKSELSAGVLYYRLETADFSATKKMIVIE